MKQLSVFLENREGRLEDVLNLLKEENINIISFIQLLLFYSSYKTPHIAFQPHDVSFPP